MDSKQPVRLRRRKISGGLESLYLDIYVGGRRSYEFLKLYLVQEKSRTDKEKNRETMRMAEAVRAKRIVEIQNGTFGFDNVRGNVRFLDYFKGICDAKLETKERKTWSVWNCCYEHLSDFCKPSTTLGDITPDWVKQFKRHLDAKASKARGKGEKLSDNTRALYFSKLSSCLLQAVRDGLLPSNPAAAVEGYKKQEAEHVYLTLDEIRRFAAQPCKKRWQPDRRAYLFSCLTGIRKSDIERMTWKDVSEENGFTRITFRQKKTKNVEYLDITPYALEYMGERGDPEQRVFAGFRYNTSVTPRLRAIARAAEINKKITFHSARHSFALLMLELGEDLYTVSKLLGHRSIRTTQIYAKILDQKKQSAVGKIPKL